MEENPVLNEKSDKDIKNKADIDSAILLVLGRNPEALARGNVYIKAQSKKLYGYFVKTMNGEKPNMGAWETEVLAEIVDEIESTKDSEGFLNKTAEGIKKETQSEVELLNKPPAVTEDVIEDETEYDDEDSGRELVAATEAEDEDGGREFVAIDWDEVSKIVDEIESQQYSDRESETATAEAIAEFEPSKNAKVGSEDELNALVNKVGKNVKGQIEGQNVGKVLGDQIDHRADETRPGAIEAEGGKFAKSEVNNVEVPKLPPVIKKPEEELSREMELKMLY